MSAILKRLTDRHDKTRKRSGKPDSVTHPPSLLLYFRGSPQVIPLVRSVPIVIGRTESADVAIDDPELSRRHARFVWSGDAVTVEDLGSTNGTFANGRRVDRIEVQHGDEVLLGSVTVGVHSLSANTMEPVPELVVSNPFMQQLHEEAARVARSDLPVLLTGETGVGKEIIAQLIRSKSRRSVKPFRVVNCGAITPTLVQSEFFGHERGAFTGADRRTAGVFEQADGGTVFLDEIGELPLDVQTALLRVLETGTLARVGSPERIAVDVRVVAATNRDLAAMCEEGTFRLDLLYRLNAVTLWVPPLRERVEEVALFAEHFLARSRERHGSRVRGFTPDALAYLQKRRWPGNIRELRNVVERASIVATGDQIAVGDLTRGGAPPELTSGTEVLPETPCVNLKERVRQFEGELILQALRRHRFNQSEAARELRVPVRTLAHRIKLLELKRHFPQ